MDLFVILFVLCALALGVWSTLVEPNLLRVRDLGLRSPKWPAAQPALRIALMADLHTGAPHATLDKLGPLVRRINAEEPDVVLLAGDFIQGVLFGRTVEPEPIARELGGLTAKHGVFAVLGNHDWDTDGPRMWRALEGAGITVLENKAAALQLPGGRAWIAGIADDTTRTPNPAGVVGRLPADEPVIALTHDPAVFPEMPRRVAVTFAGHTHGGQVALPGFGALVNFSRAPLRHSYGLIEESGKHMYVTSGIGTSLLPIRFNMPPEIVIFTLSAAALPPDATYGADSEVMEALFSK